jgi:sugar (pentulose or hexulose) kinase
MAPLLVGLDVGTTSSKAVAFTPEGRPVGEGRVAMPWVHNLSGTEADPRAVLSSACDALGRALAEAPDEPVAAIGVTSIAESGVLLDRAGAPVAPVIAWHDTRDTAEVAELAATFGEEGFARHTGLPLRGQWSLTKHRWLAGNHPAAKHAVRRLNIAEWVVRGLGGEEAAEQSLASRTGWLELSTRRWWTEALEWSGARMSLMPEVVTAGTPLGRVTASACISRAAGAILTVAGHDHQAAAVGAGACSPGDVLDSCGTAEALVRTVPAHLESSSVVTLARGGITTGWHVLPGHWCLLGATQGGLTLQRVLGVLGRTTQDLLDLDRDALASNVDTISIGGTDGGPVSISGIASGAGPGDVWRAALEAVTALASQVHEAMSTVVGGHRRLVAVGGWCHSLALLEVKRRCLGPLRRVLVTEPGARGAALLAGLAAGLYTGTEEFPAPPTEPLMCQAESRGTLVSS